AQLVRYFKEDFADYCKKNNIVSEFVRFHPLVRNAKKFKGMYEVKYSRQTVGTNLKKYDDPFQEEFSRSCRKNVRRALREGVSYKVTAAPDNIDSFKEIYYQTMDRNNANEYYYFDDQYFSQCLKYFKSNLLIVKAIYDDKTIAMGFYFIYDKTIHIHLSGTLNDYLYLSPAYILRYAVTQWGKENGYDLIHHGGGRSGRAKDSLYLFKKQFGANTSFDFFLGKKIWNTGMYEKLCLERGVDANIEFFPAYRERI
ncbi:MAG TPA: GNAT family N-acetyltransferase, partial [Candidatus Eisenbacteria bacterium]|nr:GNAT family N-acetyltransferase [Candidatus Eisenbacteria bacterium]